MPREDLLDTSLDDRLPERESKSRMSLDNSSQEIVHLVCCRRPVWDVAFCGMPADHVNLDAEVICTMCIEVVEGLSPGVSVDEARCCPVDRTPCPSEDEVLRRILREVNP